MSKIRAACEGEDARLSDEWFFVDVGFSNKRKTCGFLKGDGKAEVLTFAALSDKLVALVETRGGPANIVIEAPLSVAFDKDRNPVGRFIEFRNGQSRYWYVGLGCSVLVAATYLLRAVTDARVRREVRLFEGLVSFKAKGVVSSHTKDVLDLRSVVWGEPGIGRIVSSEELQEKSPHVLQSAFKVAGMDYGVPPVVLVEPPPASSKRTKGRAAPLA